jgi:hypothetical protein
MTIKSHTELVMQRRQTRAMIECDPSNILLHREENHRNNLTGGTHTIPVDLPEQKGRMLYGYIGRRGRMNEPENETLMRVPYAKDTLLMRHDADVERGDDFVLDGVTYRVSYIYENREYETLCNLENTGESTVTED